VRVQVKKWGNSASVRIPAPILESAKLAVDDPVEIREEGGRIVIEPVDREEFNIEDLVAGITPENRHAEISFGPPVGRELL
jgi:antitoxin MazE